MKKLEILMRRGWKWALVAGFGVLASCSGPAPTPLTSGYNNAGGVATAGLRSGDFKGGGASEMPWNRPGLGTGFGRKINSSMAYTDFVRASAKAASVSTIRYNDSKGAEAMGVSRLRRGPGLQKVDEGYVDWGVKSQGRVLRNQWWRGGRFVIGKSGRNYSLVVKNRSKSRLEVVLSVDGLDVIDGKAASTKKRGYLVYPGKTLEVKGFRTSFREVAAFQFSSVADSYTNLRHGDTRNVGVVGLAVFTEKGVNPWRPGWRDAERRGNARAFAEEPIYRARTESD